MNEIANFCNGECQKPKPLTQNWKLFVHEILSKHGSSMTQKWKTRKLENKIQDFKKKHGHWKYHDL